jgi:hypothetical protein
VATLQKQIEARKKRMDAAAAQHTQASEAAAAQQQQLADATKYRNRLAKEVW